MRTLLIVGLAVVAAPLAGAPRAPAKFEPAKVEQSAPRAPAKFEPTDPLADCPRTATVHTLDHGEALQPRKLIELPPANQYAAVYRRIGGCEVPLVVRYNVGG